MADRHLHCMVVDDEPSARDVIEKYITDAPNMSVSAICCDALEALKYMESDGASVDVIFLDINMPGLTGIELLKSRQELPPVVLTTAYDDHAVEAYDLDVVDYLLKPIPFERFLNSVEKVRNSINSTVNSILQQSDQPHIIVKADGKAYRLELSSIYYVESTGDYVTYHTESGKITSYDTLKNVDSSLANSSFVRIHKSYIVNLTCVEFLEGNHLKLPGTYLPIGPTYRKTIKALFNT